MPWNIQHKCNDADGPIPYGLARGHMMIPGFEAAPVTKAVCETCGEILTFLGHELFEEAQPAAEVGSGLPPGFVIPRSVRA